MQVNFFEGRKVTKIAAGGFHSLAVTADNEIFGWGKGVYGACGYGDFNDTGKPKQIALQSSAKEEVNLEDPLSEDLLEMFRETGGVRAIAAGGHHSMILMNNGQLFTFGYGTHG